MLKPLNNSSVGRVERPARILQFGEGNFLRAFADWMIDIANEKGVTDTSVAIVKPRSGNSRTIDALNSQDCLYDVCLEGIDNGEPRRESRLITSVKEAFTPDNIEKFDEYIYSPDLRFVISNTTEAGIRYENDDVSADVPSSFPGKVTRMLWRRYNHFNGDRTKGLYFICCELIEDNGTRLREYVIRHAREARLGEDFIDWVENACFFVDTLVDRIVSGTPDDPEAAKEEVGYDDSLIVKGELYHLWAIGGDSARSLKEELPLDKAGLNVLFMDSIKAFRDKKVRILNGSHTGMVAMSLLAGCETVKEAFDDRDINLFVTSMVEKEVIPAVDGDRDELRRFAAEILERFYNPYIRHQLKSIALNSLSKWEARNFSTVRDTKKKFGRLADHELFTFAALLALYAPGSGFEPQDNSEHVSFIRGHWDDSDLEKTVRDIVGSDIFVEDFEAAVPGFCGGVAEYLKDIRTKGIRTALTDFLNGHK